MIRKTWCKECGAEKGKCKHKKGYTNNINEAYKAWLNTLKQLKLNS